MKTAFPLSNLNRPSNDTISHYWKRCLVIKKELDIQQLFLDHACMPYVAISRSVCLCVDLPKIYQLDKLTEQICEMSLHISYSEREKQKTCLNTQVQWQFRRVLCTIFTQSFSLVCDFFFIVLYQICQFFVLVCAYSGTNTNAFQMVA